MWCEIGVCLQLYTRNWWKLNRNSYTLPLQCCFSLNFEQNVENMQGKIKKDQTNCIISAWHVSQVEISCWQEALHLATRGKKKHISHTHTPLTRQYCHMSRIDSNSIGSMYANALWRETTFATWVFFVVVFLSEVKYNLLFAMRKQVYALASARTISTVLPAMETKVTIYELRRRKR